MAGAGGENYELAGPPSSSSLPSASPLDVRKFTVESPRPPPRDIYELFPSAHGHDDNVLSAIRPAWKRTLHQLLERPTSSQAAFIVNVSTTSLIILSALITVLETVPAFHSIENRVWFGMETTLVALFTVEYIARCLAWSYSVKSFFRYLFSFFGIVDLLSVLPYYIQLLIGQDTAILFRFSILRVFRLVRVFRPFRYNHTILLTIEVMYLSVRRSQHALLAIGFFVMMILTVFSTLLYFAERGTWDEVMEAFVNSDGDPTQFASIPAAAWFVVVTITTVGYGEITPRSFLGRLVTLPIMVFGLLLITLPSFVLGREFSLVWQQMTEDRDNHASPRTSRDERLPDTAPLYPPQPTEDARSRPYRPPGSAQYGAFDPFIHSPASSSRDLTNMKLAQNQTELSRQITELTEVVEVQGRMVGRLLELLGEEGVRERLVVGGGEKGKMREAER